MRVFQMSHNLRYLEKSFAASGRSSFDGETWRYSVCRVPGDDAFRDECSLELGQGGKDPADELSGCGGGIDCCTLAGEHFKADAAAASSTLGISTIALAERLEIVQSIRYVDKAVVKTVPDKLKTWRQVGFTVFFKGDDWRGTEKGEHLERECAAVDGEIVSFPYTTNTSSTVLRHALEIISGMLGASSGHAPDA